MIGYDNAIIVNGRVTAGRCELSDLEQAELNFVDMLKQRKAMQSLLKKLRELTRSLLAPEDRIVVPKKEEIIAEFCSNPTNKEQFGEELPATDDIASAWSRREREPVSSLTYKEWRAALAVFSSHHIDTDQVKEQ